MKILKGTLESILYETNMNRFKFYKNMLVTKYFNQEHFIMKTKAIEIQVSDNQARLSKMY